jgi:flagellar basal-body rod protein FlgC
MSLFTALDINTSGFDGATAPIRSHLVKSQQRRNHTNLRRRSLPPQGHRVSNTAFGSAMRSADGGSEGVEVGAVMTTLQPRLNFVMSRDIPTRNPTTGYVSYPNVNTSEEMINMMSAARSYEANIAAISILKTMINRTLELGR